MNMDRFREPLRAVLAVLTAEGRTSHHADQIEAALAGSDDEVAEYLTSNELWGGPGSLADQALLDEPEARCKLEKCMAVLGTAQIAAGLINPRTEMWVQAFRSWR